MIFYLSPYAVNRDIGGVYNKQIELLPDDCWICITDQDICFLLPDTKAQIQSIADNGEFELYGCMTNRLGFEWQLHNGKISDDPDIRNHIEIAKYLQTQHGNDCLPTNKQIAGMLMLFKKETWLKYGKFTEKSKIFDREFSEKVQSKAIMTGVYIFHLYRFLSKSPVWDSRHLNYKK